MKEGNRRGRRKWREERKRKGRRARDMERKEVGGSSGGRERERQGEEVQAQNTLSNICSTVQTEESEMLELFVLLMLSSGLTGWLRE